MFGLTMCHCLRKLINVGSLFKLLFAYNTFVPFSFTGESTFVYLYTSDIP